MTHGTHDGGTFTQLSIFVPRAKDILHKWASCHMHAYIVEAHTWVPLNVDASNNACTNLMPQTCWGVLTPADFSRSFTRNRMDLTRQTKGTQAPCKHAKGEPESWWNAARGENERRGPLANDITSREHGIRVRIVVAFDCRMVNHDGVLLCYGLTLTAYIFFHAGSVLYVFVSRDYERTSNLWLTALARFALSKSGMAHGKQLHERFIGWVSPTHNYRNLGRLGVSRYSYCT